MKKVFFTAIVLGFAAICNAQQNKADTSIVRFSPPVIIKNEKVRIKSKPATAAKFTPPVVVKDKPLKSKKEKSNKVKFIPPVIVKDSEKK